MKLIKSLINWFFGRSEEETEPQRQEGFTPSETLKSLESEDQRSPSEKVLDDIFSNKIPDIISQDLKKMENIRAPYSDYKKRWAEEIKNYQPRRRTGI